MEYIGEETFEGVGRTLEAALDRAWDQADSALRASTDELRAPLMGAEPMEFQVHEIWLSCSNPINDVRIVIGKKK